MGISRHSWSFTISVERNHYRYGNAKTQKGMWKEEDCMNFFAHKTKQALSEDLGIALVACS